MKNFRNTSPVTTRALSYDVLNSLYMVWTGVRAPPPPKLGPPKTLGPSTHRDSWGPPSKTARSYKRESSSLQRNKSFLLGNSHLCSDFLYYTESREQSKLSMSERKWRQKRKIFWIQLPKWLKIAWKLTNLTGFTDQPPTIATFMEIPPHRGVPPLFPKIFSPRKIWGHLPVSLPK